MDRPTQVDELPQADRNASRSSAPGVEDFRRAVWDHYHQQGRRFPWRETKDPWGILLSEVMLQQTQTERVVPYWERWIHLWNTPVALAEAPLDEVLREWSGLGYNRRARFLMQTASLIAEKHENRVPKTIAELESLPGIGSYTARAIACFAFGAAETFIETNIRAAAIHFFFQGSPAVKDADIFPVLEQALDRGDPRRWHWALMDYGAALKKITVNPNRKSVHYLRQSKFEGSLRQARGAIIKHLANQGPSDLLALIAQTGVEAGRTEQALSALRKEGMVAEASGVYRIA